MEYFDRKIRFQCFVSQRDIEQTMADNLTDEEILGIIFEISEVRPGLRKLIEQKYSEPYDFS